MRWRDIICEGGMSDLAQILDDFRKLSGAKVSIDPDRNAVLVDFVLHGQPGRMRMIKRPEGGDVHRAFRRKVFAAATASNRGQPPETWEQAVRLVSGNARPRAIRILTNPATWKIDGLSYAGFRF